MERRGFSGEIRIEEDAAGVPRIRGYAAVFDQETRLWGDYFEVIRPGAFGKSLRDKPDVVGLWQHDSSWPLGRTSAGTLTVWEDDHGLGYEIRPDPTPTHQDRVFSPLRRGEVRGSSFGFRALVEQESIQGDRILRELKEVELHEVSPVTFPAYAGTEADLRELRETRLARAVARGAAGLTPGSAEAMILAKALEALRAPTRPAPRRSELERKFEQRQ